MKKIKNTIILFSAAAAVSLASAGQQQNSPSDLTNETEVAAAADTITPEDYDSMELDEFVIVKHRNLVKSDGATLTYNVTEDPEAGSSNILDILRKVPGISVDAEDNVKVNGQSNFKILMDGHENPMLKGDIKTILKSLPAATIKKIEVISEPGAKYDAEGVGGILNIVTDKKQNLSGFLTQASAWVNAYQAGGYLNGRVKLNKVMLDATVSYNDGKVWPRPFKSSRHLEYLGDSPYLRQDIEQKAKSGWDYTGTNLNMSWEPDSLNLLTLAASYGYNTWFSRGEDTRTMILSDGSTDWSIHRDNYSPGTYNSAGAQLSYQHNFGRDSHSLAVSYEYNFAHQKNSEQTWLNYLNGNGAGSPFNYYGMKGNFITHIAQLDYTNHFNKKHLLEAGAKLNLNSNSSFNRTYVGETDENITEQSAMRLMQPKDIYALYSTYTGSFGKWNVKAGLRYEYTRMGIRYRLGDYDNFTSRLYDWVPNLAASYNLNEATALRFAYQMRISRPQIYQINPFINNTTPGQISYGNPDLKSEKGHTFSLSYNNYQGAVSGSAKLSYTFVNNQVCDIMFMKDNVLNSTLANAGKHNAVRLDLNGNWDITQDLQWTLSGSVNYSYDKAESELLHAKSVGWSTDISTGLYYTLPNRLRLSADASYWTPWRDINSRVTTNGYWYSLGASRSFLKDDALTIRVNASSFLPVNRKNSYVQEDPTVKFTSITRYQQWNVGLSVSFKFGALKTSVKSTTAKIEKENNGGGSGGNSNK